MNSNIMLTYSKDNSYLLFMVFAYSTLISVVDFVQSDEKSAAVITNLETIYRYI